jgi:Tfp pilus assembly protein PilV
VLEVVLSLLILTSALAGLVQLVATAAAMRRTSETRRLAAQEVANQAERLALLAWEELTPERLAALTPSEFLTSSVPTAKLTGSLTAVADPPESKRMRIEVAWTDASGQTVEPVGLTIWKHRVPEGTP